MGKRRPTYLKENRHHLCFPRRTWNRGKARIVRDACVRMLDVDIHNELHATVPPVPVPRDIADVARLVQSYDISKLDAANVAHFLYMISGDRAFQDAMYAQYVFLKKHPS